MTMLSLAHINLRHLSDQARKKSEAAYYKLPQAERTSEKDHELLAEHLEILGLCVVRTIKDLKTTGLPFSWSETQNPSGEYLTYLATNSPTTFSLTVQHQYAEYLHDVAAQLYRTLDLLPRELVTEGVGEVLVAACKTASDLANAASKELGLQGIAGRTPGGSHVPSGTDPAQWAADNRQYHMKQAQRHNNIHTALWGVGE